MSVADSQPSTWRELMLPTWRRPLLVGTAAGAVLMLAVWGGVQYTQLWAAQLAGSAAAAQVQLVSAGSAAIGAVISPLLLVNRSRRLGWVSVCGSALVIAELFFLTQQQFGAMFLVGVAALGAATGAVTGWLTLYLPELFPPRLRATGMGTCYNAGRVLAAFGVMLTTGPLDVRGNYPQACAIVSLVYVFGLAITPWIVETKRLDV